MIVRMWAVRLFIVMGKNGVPLSNKKFWSAWDAKRFGETKSKDFFIQEILFKSKDIWEVK